MHSLSQAASTGAEQRFRLIATDLAADDITSPAGPQPQRHIDLSDAPAQAPRRRTKVALRLRLKKRDDPGAPPHPSPLTATMVGYLYDVLKVESGK